METHSPNLQKNFNSAHKISAKTKGVNDAKVRYKGYQSVTLTPSAVNLIALPVIFNLLFHSPNFQKNLIQPQNIKTQPNPLYPISA
jgi:hypothetical protein